MTQEDNSNTDSSPQKARKIGMLTDVGQVRTVDEDSILVADLSFGVNSKSSNFHLLVVADGMGGHAKGEEASKIALSAISRSVISELVNDTSFTKLLEQGIQNANQDILDYTAIHPESSGMGTTSVCAIVEGNAVHLANVGDSRAYVISDDEIRRVTKDHSYVQQMVDEGTITPKEAEDHPMKNRILQAIGGEKTKPDLNSETLYQDDILLLCTDGLSGEVSADEMWENVKSSKPMDACKTLVDLANERGGPDNSTVIIVRVEKGPKPAPVTTTETTQIIQTSDEKSDQSNIFTIILVAIVAIVAI